VVFIFPSKDMPIPDVFVMFPRFAVIVMEPPMPLAIILLLILLVLYPKVAPVALETPEITIGPLLVDNVSCKSKLTPELAVLVELLTTPFI
jgi:hypothetical protein